MSYCDACTSFAVVGVPAPKRLAACGRLCAAPAGLRRRAGDSSDSWYLPSMSRDLSSDRHTGEVCSGMRRTDMSSRACLEAVSTQAEEAWVCYWILLKTDQPFHMAAVL